MSYVDDNCFPAGGYLRAELHWSIFLYPLAWLLVDHVAVYAFEARFNALDFVWVAYSFYGGSGAVAALVTSTTSLR
jgi:hypothetical protein